MIEVRKDDKGDFDELVGGPFTVHMEMLDDTVLWIGLTDENEKSYTVVIASKKPLVVKVEEE